MSRTMMIIGNPNQLGRGTRVFGGGPTIVTKGDHNEASARYLFRKACYILNLFSNDKDRDKKIDEVFKEIFIAGGQEIRNYHDFTHFLQIANGLEEKGLPSERPEDVVEAVRFLSGMFHDVVYHHVDIKAGDHTGFSQGVQNVIGKYIDVNNGEISLKRDADLANDALFNATMQLFGFDETQRAEGSIKPLSPFNGQNEFLSALYAIEQSRKIGIPDRYILAEIGHVRGTVPFQSKDKFKELGDLYHELNSKMQPPLPENTIKEMIKSFVRMANDDVASFRQEDFSIFINNTYNLMLENARGGSDKLDDPDVLLAACMGPIGFLGMVAGKSATDGSMRIFHGVPGEPPSEELEKWEVQARKNISKMKTFLSANAAAAALVTALQVSNNNLTSLDGVSLKGLLRGDTNLDPLETEKLSRDDREVLKSLKGGSQLETSQVAAFLLERLGAEKVQALTALANKTGIQASNGKAGIANKESADAFLSQALNGLDDVKAALSGTVQGKQIGAGPELVAAKKHHGFHLGVA